MKLAGHDDLLYSLNTADVFKITYLGSALCVSKTKCVGFLFGSLRYLNLCLDLVLSNIKNQFPIALPTGAKD